MHITVAILQAGYELLRTTPPMRGWRLLPSDEVAFHAVPLGPDKSADYDFVDGVHCIRLCLRHHSKLHTVLATIAHEMCHMRLRLIGYKHWKRHDAEFKKLAKHLCRVHGWDEASF